MTDVAVASNDPRHPTELPCAVRLACPDGEVQGMTITREDGEVLRNVMRAVIALESEVLQVEPPGKAGKARVFITCFDASSGMTAYYVADATF